MSAKIEVFVVIAAIIIVIAMLFSLKRLINFCLRKVVVYDYERALLYQDGRYLRTLQEGAHWIWAWTQTVSKVDMRARIVSVPGQELLSADSIGLKVSLAAKYRVVDPYVALHHEEYYLTALYMVLQVRLREIVGTLTVDELLEKRNEIGSQILASCLDRVKAMGCDLLEVSIKDTMFPGDLKKVFSQVVKAQKEGQAMLERARGETAALRNLANAARLCQSHPSLMELRAIQAVGETSGNTLVLGLPSSPVLVGKQKRSSGGDTESGALDEDA